MASALRKIGESVRHKSGGPIVVIEHIEGEYATCSWHDDKIIQREKIPLAVLESVPKPEGPTVKTSGKPGRLTQNIWLGRGR